MRALAFFLARKVGFVNEEYQLVLMHDQVAIQPGTRLLVENFFAMAILECAPSEGSTHDVTVQILDADERNLWPHSPTNRATLVSPGAGRPLRVLQQCEIEGLILPDPGDYRIILLVDGTRVADLPIYAIEPGAAEWQ